MKNKYGREWISRWYDILEMVAEKMNETDRCSLALPVSEWCKHLDCTTKKLRSFLHDGVSALSLRYEENAGTLVIEIPNLLKRRDEYTSRLGSKSGETPSTEGEVEGEIEGEVEGDTEGGKEGALTTLPTPPPKQTRKYANQPLQQPPTNGHSHQLAEALHTGNTVCDEVIRTMHRIGQRTSIAEYQNISAISWIPDLRAWGLKIGYQCLLATALKLEQHMLTSAESGKLAGKKHNPRNKFFQVWLPRVYAEEKTTGDLDLMLTDTPSRQPKDFDV